MSRIETRTGGSSASMRLRRFCAGALALVGTTLALMASADDYSDSWGPEIGAPLPVLEAFDQSGTLRTVENLAGERGLLLFMSRSADW